MKKRRNIKRTLTGIIKSNGTCEDMENIDCKSCVLYKECGSVYEREHYLKRAKEEYAKRYSASDIVELML